MRVHLVDGTYELFRAHYGAPGSLSPEGKEVGATRGLARSLLALLRDEGATHVAVAFDHVVESFRNELFDGYKTGEGIEPALHAQFETAERMTRALGIVTWPMVEFEADDALASGAHQLAASAEVEQVMLCTPDKDLAQCVSGTRVVRLDRRRRAIADEQAIRDRYGIGPRSIPDWLALVGDASDGIPGIPRWGERSASAVLGAYEHLDRIPADPDEWIVSPRGKATLARNLEERREDALLYRRLAILRTDVPIAEDLEGLRWRGARRDGLHAICEELGDDRLPPGIDTWC